MLTATREIMSIGKYDENVSSDRAMLDSGHRYAMVYWDHADKVVRSEYHNPEFWEPLPVDCTDATFQLAQQYLKAVNWVRNEASRCWKARQAAREVRVGDKVEVYKGRKIPLGTYTVRYIGEGNYGRYYDLVGTDGRYHRYISVDNCRKVAQVSYVGIDYPEWLADLDTYKNKETGDKMQVFADFLDERGDERAAHIRNWGKALSGSNPYNLSYDLFANNSGWWG